MGRTVTANCFDAPGTRRYEVVEMRCRANVQLSRALKQHCVAHSFCGNIRVLLRLSAVTRAVKRQHEPQRIVGDLLNAEISEKQARSIKYQLTIAKLPLAKDLDDFQFQNTPINETLVHDLAGGGFIAQQRNA